MAPFPLVIMLQFVNLSKANLYLHVYQLHQGGPVSEELDEEDDITAAQHWILPCSVFARILHTAAMSAVVTVLRQCDCACEDPAVYAVPCLQATFRECGKASCMTQT